MAVTLGIYWVTPWIRWDRGPNAPDQAVLVDLANRRFYFFFIEIWPQEFYYIAGLLIMAGLGLFLVTSVAGRAWCGYTCPQTVWTDLYIWVERLDRGRPQRPHAPRQGAVGRREDRQARRPSTSSGWSSRSAPAAPGCSISPTRRRSSHDLFTLQAAPVAYITVGVLTATTFIFAGFMREQVCTYMCPWPRIQGAMLDEDSLLVTYNAWRGEPRSHGKKRALAEGVEAGDCIDCNACVVVCPMGIDIRDGNQLECITCALCIDACNDIMRKVGQAAGADLLYDAARLQHARGGGGDGGPRRGDGASAHRRRLPHRAPAHADLCRPVVADRASSCWSRSSPATGSTSTSCPTAIRSSSRSPTARSATATR